MSERGREGQRENNDYSFFKGKIAPGGGAYKLPAAQIPTLAHTAQGS